MEINRAEHWQQQADAVSEAIDLLERGTEMCLADGRPFEDTRVDRFKMTVVATASILKRVLMPVADALEQEAERCSEDK